MALGIKAGRLPLFLCGQIMINFISRIKWILSEFYYHKNNYLIFVLGLSVSHVLAIIPPIISMNIIDKVIVSASISSLKVVVVVLFVINLSSGVLSALNKSLYGRTGLTVTSQISEIINNHLFHLPFLYFQSSAVGDNIAKMNEVDKLKGFVDSWVLTRSVELIFSMFYMAFMFWLSPGMTIISIIIIPINAIIYAIANKPARVVVQKQYEASKNYQASLIDSLDAIETIKSYKIERFIVSRLKNKFDTYISEVDKLNHIDIKLSLATSIAATLIECLSIFYGTSLVISGELTLGTLFAFQLIVGRAIQPLQASTSMIHEFNEAKNALDRISDIKESPMEENNDSQGDIDQSRIHAVHLSEIVQENENKSKTLIKVDSLMIEQGEKIFISGPSGAGKSTLGKIISGLIIPTSGNVIINIGDKFEMMSRSYRPSILYIPQSASIFRGTVRQNVSLFNDSVNDSQLAASILKVGLCSTIDEATEYLEHIIDEGGANISGGQKQRISLARIFLINSGLIILDESTSSLDFNAEMQIIDALLTEKANITIIMISHRASLAALFERLVVIDGGVIQYDGDYSAELV